MQKPFVQNITGACCGDHIKPEVYARRHTVITIYKAGSLCQDSMHKAQQLHTCGLRTICRFCLARRCGSLKHYHTPFAVDHLAGARQSTRSAPVLPQHDIRNQKPDVVQDTIPWEGLQYVTGQINYGGRVTDDNDRILLMHLLQRSYSPSTLLPNFSFTPDGTYSLPPSEANLENCISQIQGLPAKDVAGVFSLHPNADTAFQLQVRLRTFSHMMFRSCWNLRFGAVLGLWPLGKPKYCSTCICTSATFRLLKDATCNFFLARQTFSTYHKRDIVQQLVCTFVGSSLSVPGNAVSASEGLAVPAYRLNKCCMRSSASQH